VSRALEESLAKTNTDQTLYRFMEDDKGEIVGHTGFADPTVAMTDRGAYKDWFSRPVLLEQISWSENTAFPARVYFPWYSYFTNSVIKSKISGFSRLRADLKIKVVVNGSPFRYGDAMVSYRPLYDSDPTAWTNTTNPFFSGGQISGDISGGTVFPGGSTPGALFADALSLMARSQRMNFHVLPQTNAGGEMTLPFIYYRDAIPLTDIVGSGQVSDQALKEMGTLHIQNVVSLTSTAAANASPVTVSVYMWAENVELWGPTQLTVQFRDEFGDVMKPSQVASAVADSAAKLSPIPVIGPYAMAASFAATCVSKVLRLFGWSNPPVITGVPGVVPKTSFLNPNPLTSFQDDVVAMDPKNEVTVDPRTVGCLPADDLMVDTFCKREAIFDTITWNVTDAPATALLTAPVTPHYSVAQVVANTATPSAQCIRRQMTPATYAAQLFRYWRGTFCLRVRVVASQFHRGRLAIAWDPSPAYSTQSTTSQITDILDLATADEIVFRVPFMAPTGMLGVNNYPSTANTPALVNTYTLWGNRATSASLTNFTLRSCCNGVIYITVLNELQCGDATANATLVCSTWFEDMKFGCPNPDLASGTFGITATKGLSNISYNNFVAQGLEAPDGTVEEDTIPIVADCDHLSALYSGEAVPSLRSLLHRTYFHRAVNFTTTGPSYVWYTFPRFPTTFHNKAFQFNDSNTGGTGELGTLSTNYTVTTPIAYLTACFVGHRGAMVWKAMTTDSYRGVGSYFSTLGRASGTAGSGLGLQLSTAGASRANSLRSFLGSILGGSAASLQSNNGVTSGVFPMYSMWRMHPGNMSAMYTAAQNTTVDYNPNSLDTMAWFGCTNAAGSSDLLLSVAAGTDYNVFGFVNVPEVFLATSLG